MANFNEGGYRNLSPCIRAWERWYRARGWNGSPSKLKDVAWKKANRGRWPHNRRA